jgi:hypothetical protein
VPRPTLRLAAVVACLAWPAACGGGRDESVPVCAKLSFYCPVDADPVTLHTVRERGFGLGGPHAQGVGDDLILDNGLVTAIIDALDTPHLLAPTGGNLLDFAPVGRDDELNQVYQVAGILPDDALRYDSLTPIEVDDGRAVLARGHLDGRPDVAVETRYELHRCETGLRIRTELHNGGHEPFAFFLADVAYWGGREPIPFTPLPGQGFVQPELELADPDSAWGHLPFVATNTGLAWVSCDRDHLEGLNDDSVTAIGAPRQIVYPGERVVYERYLVAGAERNVESAVRVAQAVREQLGQARAPEVLSGLVRPADLSCLRAPVTLVASALASDGRKTPWTQLVLDGDGHYALTVPADEVIEIEAWQFGRPVAQLVAKSDVSHGVPDLVVPDPATLAVTVSDGGAQPFIGEVVIVPADAETRTAVSGTELGRFGTCAPWLGPPHGGSPACNRVLVTGTADVSLPAGHYFVYASAGPFWTLARQELTFAPGERVPATFLLADLRGALVPGLLSTDLHVHGRASFDSSIPDATRVLSFVASGVDVIAATDHDAVQDYHQALAENLPPDRIAVMAGVETTGLIPFMHIPGDSFPRVIGHFNFWPVTFDASQPRNGAPWDERLEPGALFDLMEAVMPPDHAGVMMLNHPWDEPLFGRDLGYLRAVGFDPRKPIPAVDDGTAQGVLARRPAGGHGNLDFDVLEILNGHSITKFLQYRQIWWALLAQGRVHPGAANSDSHGLSDAQIGWPRNLVATSTQVAGFDEATMNADVRAGHMTGGYGVVIVATVGGAPFGMTPVAGTDPDATLDVEVRAAPWIPVSEVRFVVNGRVVRTDPVTTMPADPFGAGGLVRYQAKLPLAALLGAGTADAWLLVEAGLPLPEAVDLDDDGIVDTTDITADGVIDQRDVEAGEDHGPLTDPADPAPWSEDPRRHVAVVAPGTWPVAFTNPFLIDRDGDGTWAAPGL